MNGDRSDVFALDLDGLNMVLRWIMNLVERSSEAGSNHIVDCCGSNRFSFRFDLKGEVSLLDGDNHVVGGSQGGLRGSGGGQGGEEKKDEFHGIMVVVFERRRLVVFPSSRIVRSLLRLPEGSRAGCP